MSEQPRVEQDPALPGVPEHHRIAIIGTGHSGLGAAIRLLQSGERDFVALERAGDVGGCWRDNTYPTHGRSTRWDGRRSIRPSPEAGTNSR